MASKNIELKFIRDSAHQLDGVLSNYHFDSEEFITQEDIYLYGESCYFKLRINNGSPSKLLKYRRLTSPVLRESDFESFNLDEEVTKATAKYIFDNTVKAGVVKKRRRQLRCEDFLLNMDAILSDDGLTELYSVVEIEYFVRADNSETAQRKIDRILGEIKVKPYQIVPYSNIHMVNMLKASQIYRRVYVGAMERGRLILVDGGSGTGKSTIKDLLVNEWRFNYAKRDTTRSPRSGDLVSDDYNFVSPNEFYKRAISGHYIEFRDFLFGMSYALPWKQFIEPLCHGSNVMALINLGNGFFTKKLFPDATVVLLYAEVETIRTRLVARGNMTSEQIEERLENNRLAVSYAEAYDLNVDTSKFGPEEVARQIVQSV